ncbi:MAG: hypothetical protein KKB51_14355 [Candidatus Riflebacteria bacterium]|nr:hypothetical protein [Candidatus Riflebacteria bacterium]
MKRLMLLCLILVFSVTSQQLRADDDSVAITMSILSSIQMVCDFICPVDTFEDVKPITGIRATFAGDGPLIKQGEISSDFQGFAEKSTADKFFTRLKNSGGLILETGNLDFVSFLLANLYLEYGSLVEDKITGEKTWVSKQSHPSSNELVFEDYKTTRNPHEKKYFLCLDASYKYIKFFTQPLPNSLSCDDYRRFCTDPPCEKDGEEEDPDDPSKMVPTWASHIKDTDPAPPNNIYKELAKTIMDNCVDASPIVEKQSGIEFTMKFKDRTPPRIDGCVNGDFPELGANQPATTGDWYKVEGLRINDNSGGKIGTALLMGKIDDSPRVSWSSDESWILEKPTVIESGSNADQIVMPNSCHGFMRYTLYAWDRNGNLNPGDPNIYEDDPLKCYGLGPTVTGAGNVDFTGSNIDLDLSDEPDKAREWPIKVEFRKEEDFDDTYVEELKAKLNADFRRGQGFINIRDNDLPNIVIRIESVKDGSRIFFPPIIPYGDPDFSIVHSTKYKSGAAPADLNVGDYVDFIAPSKGGAIIASSSSIADGSQEMYFRIVDIIPSDGMRPSEKDLMINKYIIQPDLDFIKKHFRLEDFEKSDTRQIDGAPELDPLTFGKRNSFGKRVVALLELPGKKAMIQEDVEYLIDVWADDNIKWATIDGSGQKLDNIINIPTGVQNGEMTVEIPNQYPRASYHVPFDRQESVNGKLRVVFREPTLPVAGSDEKELMDKHFPYIEVKATDYAGLERSMKLFIRITNENPNIRVLDRKHEQNR